MIYIINNYIYSGEPKATNNVYNNIYIKVIKELLYDAKNEHRQNFVF